MFAPERGKRNAGSEVFRQSLLQNATVIRIHTTFAKLQRRKNAVTLCPKTDPSLFPTKIQAGDKKHMSTTVRSALFSCSLTLLTCMAGFGQAAQQGPEPPATPAPQSSQSNWSSDSGRVGVGVKISLFGPGVEGAVRVTHNTNVRAGFNMFTYDRTFNKDGVSYGGQLQFKSVEAHFDIFPWAGNFHISPGVLVNIGDPFTATASVPGNQSFSLGGVDYVSNPADPTHGSGKIKFNQAAPTITVGWGNLVSRKEGKHLSVPFEVGIAFQGSPKATLNMAGSVCDSTGVNCVNAATDANVQSNVISEQNKINNDISFLKVYPIISVGIGYKF